MKLFKRVAMTLAIVAACSAAVAQATEREVFSSPTQGVELVKPEGWHFMTIGDMVRSMEMTRLKTESLRQAASGSPASIAAGVAKYPEPYPGVNPSISIRVTPNTTFNGASPVDIMNVGLSVYPLMFDDVVVTQPARETELQGYPAAQAELTATAYLKDGTIMPLRTRMWIVMRDGNFVSISAGVRQDEANGTMKEVMAVLETLKID